MKNFLGKYPDLGIFLIRIALGLVFIGHGWQKIQNLGGTAEFFGKLGLPGFMAYLVASVEFLGGIALILGVFTPVAALLIAAVMVGAIYFVKLPRGFLGGYEFELTLLLAALGVALHGQGKYSILAWFKKK